MRLPFQIGHDRSLEVLRLIVAMIVMTSVVHWLPMSIPSPIVVVPGWCVVAMVSVVMSIVMLLLCVPHWSTVAVMAMIGWSVVSPWSISESIGLLWSPIHLLVKKVGNKWLVVDHWLMVLISWIVVMISDCWHINQVHVKYSWIKDSSMGDWIDDNLLYVMVWVNMGVVVCGMVMLWVH